MAPHGIVEQDEIILMNLLKALFNSVRSNSLHLKIDVHAVADASTVFVLERIRMCERSVFALKRLNKNVKKIVVKCLEEFRKNILSSSAIIWQRLFEEQIVKPLEQVLLKVHSTKEGKAWVKTCLIIFRE